MNVLQSYRGKHPVLPSDEDYWLAPFSVLIGAVTLGRGDSVWHGATLRADNEPIVLGAGTNVQENCVLHVDPGFSLSIGENCTIGHGAILHGCKVGDGTVVGMGSVILNGAIVGKECLIGAGTVIKEKTVIPAGSLVVGAPAQIKRTLNEDVRQKLILSAENYRMKALYFRDSDK